MPARSWTTARRSRREQHWRRRAGVSGAFVAAEANVIEWLIQRARSYIYTTGASPMVAGALLASIDQILQGGERRAQLQGHIAQLRLGIDGLKLSFELVPSRTGIQALVIGDNAKTLAVSASLLEQGYWVPAIRPPTVPAGTARLRISLSAAHTDAHIAGLLNALATAAQAA